MADKYRYSNESYSGCDMVATLLIPMPDNSSKSLYTVGELQTISYSIHMDRKPVRAIGNINAKDYVMGPRTIAGSLVFAVFNRHFAKNIIKEMGENIENNYSFLMDELPPLDIIISLANEYGLRSRIVLYGVRLINEGQVMSINDIYTENTYQFVATDIEYLTDENSYSNVTSKNKNKYIIKNIEQNTNTNSNSLDLTEEEQDDKILSNVLNSNNDNNKTDNTNISIVRLNCINIKNETVYSLGSVEFILTPIQKLGVIYIRGTKNFNINLVNINANSKIAIQLPTGFYTAFWANNNIKSNELTINIKYEDTFITDDLLCQNNIPLIEDVTSDNIKISKSNSSYDTVIYSKDSTNTRSLNEKTTMKLDKANNVKINVESNSIYKINSVNNKGQNSNEIKIRVYEPFYNPFDEFSNHIENNKNKLNYNNQYIATIIDEAKLLYKTKKNDCISFAEILLTIKQNYINMPNNINDNNTIIATIDELISIATNYINDKIYSYNKDGSIVASPILEDEFFSTNNILIEKNIENVIVYKIANNDMQIFRIINKSKFKNYNDIYNICTFIGETNNLYSIYAEDMNGTRSHRIDVFIQNENTKGLLLTERKELIKELSYMNKKIENLHDENYYKLKSNEHKKILDTEIMKVASNRVVSLPKLYVINNDSIKVELSIEKSILEEAKAKIVISNINDIFIKKIKYKKDISEEILFIPENGIKKDGSYAIWIEDVNGQQISNCSVISINNPNTEVDYYHINKEIDNLFSYFTLKNINEEFIFNVLNSSLSDIENKKYNILDNILYYISSDIKRLNNPFEALSEFFIYYFNQYEISEDMLNKLVYSAKNNELTLSENYNVTPFIYSINETINITPIEIIDNKISLSKNDRFIIVNFISNDLVHRSGFILIDTVLNKVFSYKIMTEVGE